MNKHVLTGLAVAAVVLVGGLVGCDEMKIDGLELKKVRLDKIDLNLGGKRGPEVTEALGVTLPVHVTDVGIRSLPHASYRVHMEDGAGMRWCVVVEHAEGLGGEDWQVAWNPGDDWGRSKLLAPGSEAFVEMEGVLRGWLDARMAAAMEATERSGDAAPPAYQLSGLTTGDHRAYVVSETLRVLGTME